MLIQKESVMTTMKHTKVCPNPITDKDIQNPLERGFSYIKRSLRIWFYENVRDPTNTDMRG